MDPTGGSLGHFNQFDHSAIGSYSSGIIHLNSNTAVPSWSVSQSVSYRFIKQCDVDINTDIDIDIGADVDIDNDILNYTIYTSKDTLYTVNYALYILNYVYYAHSAGQNTL